MQIPGFPFSYRFRVRWSEVDPQRVVFNARYLDYADLVLTEYWRAARFRELLGGQPDFHVARAEVDFRKPVTADEQLDGWARTERFGTTSMGMLVELHGAGTSGEDLRAIIREVHVQVDLETHRPCAIAQSVKDLFTEFDARAVPCLTGER